MQQPPGGWGPHQQHPQWGQQPPQGYPPRPPKKSLSTGAIVGIVGAFLAVVFVLGSLGDRKKRDDDSAETSKKKSKKVPKHKMLDKYEKHGRTHWFVLVDDDVTADELRALCEKLGDKYEGDNLYFVDDDSGVDDYIEWTTAYGTDESDDHPRPKRWMKEHAIAGYMYQIGESEHQLVPFDPEGDAYMGDLDDILKERKN